MLIYSSLQHLDFVSLTYHSFFWSTANFCKPKQRCFCHCVLFLPFTMPPIQRSFSLLFPPSPILCLSILFCAAHTLGEQTNLAGSNNNKKRKEKEKKELFSGLEESSIFIWKEQSNLFSFYQEPRGMVMALKVSHSRKSDATKTKRERLAFLPSTQAPLNSDIKLIFNRTLFQHQAPVKNIHFYKVGFH